MLSTAPTDPSSAEQQATDRIDVLGRFDHQTQAHAVDPAEALPGRYLAVEGADGSRLVALHDPAVYVGRSFTAGLRLDDQSVSRRHAIITRRGGATWILDDRSLNGTFVNGLRVEEARLHDGDVIMLGSVLLVFREL